MTKGNSNIPTGSDISTGKKIFWTKTNGRMSFNQTFVITTTFVYIDPNTSINLCWRDFYFSFFKNLNKKLETTLVILYVPTYIYYKHDYPKNAVMKEKNSVWIQMFFLFKSDGIRHFWDWKCHTDFLSQIELLREILNLSKML